MTSIERNRVGVSTVAIAVVAWLIAMEVSAQAAPDPDFSYSIDSPAFAMGKGPLVCFDAGHSNYHGPEAAYRPFVRLLASDGYRTQSVRGRLRPGTLEDCDALVIVTPVNPANEDNWTFPHASAFETEEIRAVHGWIRQGGGLFLIVDHSPIPGAVADLASVFGVSLFDGEARNDPRRALPDVFSKDEGTLVEHPITRGRNDAESVTSFATWTGAAFMASREFRPILVYGARSRMWAELPEMFPDFDRQDYPVFEIRGWLAAAARILGEGRLVVLGEASACTALRQGEHLQGMNTDEGSENPRFCLNAVRWLVGVLD